ncbi:aminomethyl-transferring glycine dehydrogenase [Variovorax sp. VRV01]|uniref:aminomethyl-transferring glycine dehydrogenase n=1 Tax=Variovorax sp. VRV01 TaxID=2769259 RepID=UPI00177FBD1F|nr:aminomethyl-transferring glycine dehydrogenase [Variovorax sp. VRV01]MBD9664315.1 aminomethyl-transferring glycine dehydrogenase [Variovorax sp. VRV01]
MPIPALPSLQQLENAEEFLARHIGIDAADEARMLPVIGSETRAELIDGIVPAAIRRAKPMRLPAPATEADALAELKAIAAKNKVFRSFIGQGYYGTHTPGVILRNVLENPAWYTAYTPYQAEISQGRMEALLNFQTMVCDLTGMAIANASMLDEATAAAEAMTLAKRSVKSKSNVFLVSGDCHPQTIEVIKTRAAPLGIEVKVSTVSETLPHLMVSGEFFGVLAQYPATTGHVHDLRPLAGHAHQCDAAFCVAADLLALTLLAPPGEWDADIVCGTTQRFGMPMCNGGPHAAYLACRDEFKRSLPGRLVGVSVDTHGQPAYRLALQTREQHIRREKATSNICTAQVLPAVVASMYAVYHGPDGLTRIAQRVAALTAILAQGLAQMGREPVNATAFDSLTIRTGDDTPRIIERAQAAGVNLRQRLQQHLGISLDETTTRADIETLWALFVPAGTPMPRFDDLANTAPRLPEDLRRTSAFLTHPVFNTHKSETAMLRYIRSLSDKDLALDRSMIPLGSCTMKLNATSEMIPITWPEFANIHPFAPAEQLVGYAQLDAQLRAWLCEATGYAGISLQPNAGSQGEYAGLLAIRSFHEANGQGHRNICLIPSSAHGTNPASAQMVGLQVVVTACDAQGNVDMDDLKRACEKHSDKLAAVMITYPSTHGVFETRVKELCGLVHEHGGRVYVDGANMNALVGVAAPGEFGGDVSHLNLHKTFCIPHGGGGPGVGPVCVVEDLVPYLPGHATAGVASNGVGAVSAAPLGNAAVLPISWMYCRMMGAKGLQAATETAILSANYISARLKDHYPTLYASPNGHVAHECILDLRPLKDSSGVTAEDVAKRLIDYGFHAPTLSFPVPGTLMVEPTESEPLAELDRFIDAMIAIRGEIRRVEEGVWPKDDNPLKHAPHTAASLLGTEWAHPYSRELGAFPLAELKLAKYWPPIGRVDNVYGDRNLFCSCVPVGDYKETEEA